MSVRQDPRTLNPLIPVRDDGMMRTTLIRIATALDEPMSVPQFGVASSEVGNKRTIPITVVDRNEKRWDGARWLVLFWISASEYGTPLAVTGITASKGSLVEALTTNASYLGLTDANGDLSLDIEVTGAQTLYLHAIVMGRTDVSAAVDWT